MGTWRMGEDARKRKSEVAALRVGLELGMTLIDTAEMYGDGGAEEVVGEAIKGRREDAFIVSKFYPRNATRDGMRRACERSLKRLGTEVVDLYLLHWRSDVPLRETLDGFDDLLRAGKIRHAGVSNFDVSDMEGLFRLDGAERIVTDQVMYNLERRGPEVDLIPWLRQRHRPLMAYSPLEEGLLSHREHPALREVAERHDSTSAQVALAWTIRSGSVIAIPKTSREARVRENRGAVEIRLTKRDLDTLDGSFAGPDGPIPLETR